MFNFFNNTTWLQFFSLVGIATMLYYLTLFFFGKKATTSAIEKTTIPEKKEAVNNATYEKDIVQQNVPKPEDNSKKVNASSKMF